jgi:hypothetical protein
MLRWKIRCAAALAGTMLAAAAPAAPAWPLGPEGFGPLKFGMRFDQARRAGARGIKPTPPPRGNPQCDQMLLPGHPGVSLMFVDGALRRVDIYRSTVRTTRNVATGDPVARLRRAYRGLHASTHKYDRNGQYLTLGPDDGQAMRFETRAGKVSRIYAGRWQEVQLVEGCS